MRKVAVVGAGAGGAAAVAELVGAGHEVSFWGRSPATLAPFQAQGGVAYEGVLGTGLARPKLITSDLRAAIDATDVILVCLPTFAHGDVARALAQAEGGSRSCSIRGTPAVRWSFAQAFCALGVEPPPIAEFSTLTYVARKYAPGCVTITGKRRACGLRPCRKAKRPRRRRRRSSQRQGHAGRARLRPRQREHGAACAGRGARRRLGRGDARRFHLLRRRA